MQNKKIEVLECTLRDGSYAIDYQFTAEDTAIIAAGLEQAGFNLIEIGHGLGLNASTPSIGMAAASDEEYLEAASSVLKKARFGMFFIPGIGRMEDLELAAKYKMNFVRIGTNVTEIEQAEPYIKRAKELGMLVSSNLMKSYALPIDEFIKKAELAAKYGADVIAVVDSAGGMLPQDVIEYVSRIKQELGIRVGFHGHNNLLLAVANTIEAVKAGAEVVDSSLQGMGRSAGNAQTEILIIILEKLGYPTGIDLYKMMDLGEKIVKPMMGGGSGIDSISATLGYAQFHSSYLKIIYKIAQKYNLDPRELVVKVSEVDRVSVSEELAERVSLEMKKERKNQIGQGILWNINLNFKEIIRKNVPLKEAAAAIALEMLSLSKKTGKQTVFTIAGTLNKNKKDASFPFIRQNAVYIIGNAEVSSCEQAISIAQAIDGRVEHILIDIDHHDGKLAEMAERVKNTVKQSRVLTYKDSDAQVNAVDTLVSQLLGNLSDKKILVLGDNSMAKRLEAKLSDRRGRIIRISNTLETDERADLLIGITPFEPQIDQKILKQLNRGGMVVDAGPGSIFSDAIDEAHRLDVPVYRVDMRAGLSGEIINVLETCELRDKIMGRGEISGIKVVAGGVIGQRGNIVLDSITCPTRIIGVADGCGGILSDEEKTIFSSDMQKVKLSIAKAKFS